MRLLFLCAGYFTAGIKSCVVAFVLSRFVETPIFIEVSTRAQCTEAKHRLGAIKPPAGPRQVHPVLDEMPAGTLDHTRGYRKAFGKVFVIPKIGSVVEKIVGTDIYCRALLFRQAA